MLTHIARAFDGELFVPTDGDGKPPRLLQLPYLRILVQGRIGVTIFSFVTGFVCALKPLKLTRQGNREAALSSMGRSALRRVPRLVLPAAIATFVICIYAQLGAFEIAHRCDSWWIHSTSPERRPGILSAAANAVYSIVTTWTRSANEYDGSQWTLLPLLRGSMMVYAYVAATVVVQPKWRMTLSVLMWAYMYVASDCKWHPSTLIDDGATRGPCFHRPTCPFDRPTIEARTESLGTTPSFLSPPPPGGGGGPSKPYLTRTTLTMWHP